MSLFAPPAALRSTPPSDHFYASAVWLCLRHPRLLQLADRAGVVVEDQDGDTVLDLDELAAALNALDRYHAEWSEYGEPYRSLSDAEYERWEAAGPKPGHPLVPAIAPMSRTEVSRLRLLAFFAFDRTALRIHDLGGLDDEGQALLADWCAAVIAA